MRQDLNNAQGDDKKLLEWFQINLGAFQTKLAQQTDFLHQQIDEAVRQLKKDVLNQGMNPVFLLKQVRDDLTDIQKKNQELR